MKNGCEVPSEGFAEGLLLLTIHDVSSMNGAIRGQCTLINGLRWRILAMVKTCSKAKKGETKCFGFFVECCVNGYSESWSCEADAELRLKSQKKRAANFVRKTKHTYTSKENDWGYSCFLTWEEVMNCSRGYVKADTVMLEAFVKASTPKNLPAEDQFDKKMKDYMALAELQSGRGQIDKAIEANAAAWGLCKDGDCHCVNELRLQRNKLIEMKLKQRIEAIERGPDEGDSPLSRTTLKQAISRGAKKNSKPPSPKSRNSVSDSKTVEAKSIVSSMNGAKRIAIGQDKCTKTKCPDSAEQRPKELAVEARLSEFSQNKASLEGVKASSTAVDSESVMRAKKEVVDSQMDILSTGNHESKRSRNASASVGSHQADATTMGCLRTDEWGEVLSGQKGDGESVLERIISCDDDPKVDEAEIVGTVMRFLELFIMVRERTGSIVLKDTLRKLSVLAEVRNCNESPANGVAKDEGEQDMEAVVLDCVKDCVVRHRGGAATGRGDSLDDIRRYGTVIYSLLNKGIILPREQVQKMRECVKIIAIKIGKWTTENANLMKSLENTKEQLERSIKIHHTWVEQYNAEKRGFEEAKRQLHLITEKHDELKKKIKTHEKRAQHQREMDEKVGCLARKLSDTKRKFGEKLEGLREELRLSREAEKRAVRRSEDDQAQLADIRKQLSNCSLKLQSAQNALNTQMKLSNNKVALAIQRARKGEVMLLQLKLDIGVRVLVEALSDTERNICELEMKRNTVIGGRHGEQLQKVLSEWYARRKEIIELISSAKDEFAIQMDQVKGGMHLASLPRISVAVPPPEPKPFKFQQVPLPVVRIPLASEYSSSFATMSSDYSALQTDTSNITDAIGSSAVGKQLTTKPFLSEISFLTLWKPCWEEWFDRESTAPSSSVVSDGSCSNVCRLVALDSVAQQRCELNSALVAAGPVRWNKWTNIRDLSSQQMKNLWKTQATAGANSESFHRRRPHNEPMQQVNGSYGTRWNASSSAHYADLCDPRGDINSNSNLLSRRDEALDRLQMNFPALSRVKLEEYMEGLMARGHHRSLYNTPVAQIVSGVAHLISSEYE